MIAEKYTAAIMEIRKHQISLEPLVDAVSRVGSAINKTAHDVNEGIEQDYSIVEFHRHLVKGDTNEDINGIKPACSIELYEHEKKPKSSKLTSAAETIVDAAFREVFDPIHAAIKATTGETIHGKPISKVDQVKAAADATVTVIKLPRAAKTALRLARLGAEIYKAKK